MLGLRFRRARNPGPRPGRHRQRLPRTRGQHRGGGAAAREDAREGNAAAADGWQALSLRHQQERHPAAQDRPGLDCQPGQ
eukprot:5814200-Pyramimonas_sp.AAC.1